MRLALDEARQAAREDEVPVGAVLVAADAISNWSESPALSTRSFITNSAIGLRQMFLRFSSTKSVSSSAATAKRRPIPLMQ